MTNYARPIKGDIKLGDICHDRKLIMTVQYMKYYDQMTCIFKNFKPFHDMTNILAFINPESECDNVDEYVTGLDGSLYPLMGVQMGNWRQHWIQMNMEEAWTCVASTPYI